MYAGDRSRIQRGRIFFGRELLRTLDVPVGIVFSGIGASAAQALCSRAPCWLQIQS